MKLTSKKWLKLSVTAPLMLIAPTVLVSCSFNLSGNSSLNKNEQLELIKKYGKINVLNEWLTATFSTLYVDKIIDPEGSFDKAKREQAIGEIGNFLIHLEWKTKDNNVIEKQKQDELAKTVYDAYKFLVIFRSSISTGAEDIPTPANYFVNKAVTWKKDKITTVDGESLDKFNPTPGILPTKPDSKDWNSDTDFKLIFKAWGTEIFSETLKLLMGQMYFLHVNDKEIKAGTDYNKQTRTKFNKNWLEATSFDVEDRFYFLNKYLVTKNPQFKWEKKDDTASTGYVRNIQNSTDFNNLMGPTKKTMDPFLVPLTSDIMAHGTTNFAAAQATPDVKLESLRGFTKLEYDSAITDGDLSTSMDTIKTFGYERSGLLNTDNNNALVGFEGLHAKQIIQPITTNKAQAAANGNFKLPKITIKTASLTKTVRTITMNDLEMSLDTKSGTVDSTTGHLKLTDNNNQSWEVVKLSFLPQETGSESEQKINLSVIYSSTQTDKTFTVPYNFDIVWTTKGNGSIQSSLFDKPYSFDGTNADIEKMFPSLIRSTTDAKTDFSYILKPLPIFETKDSKTIEIEKQAYMTGKFSLENTIWKSTTTKDASKAPDDSAKIKLINWFVLSDDNLWKTIQDFYLFNNYNIEAKNGEFSPIISELGLNKKTQQDRKDAGIIF